MPNVSYVRPEVRQYVEEYQKISDCLIGETAVKKRRQTYLPIPNPTDTSAENMARYAAYLTRAVFYNVAARTHTGLVGAVFAVRPKVELVGPAEPLGINANGIGAGIEQLGKQTLGGVLGYGRAGLFVDYPHVETTDENSNASSVADVERQNLRPTIEMYSSEDIINWRTRVDGGVEKLSLVVLREKYIANDDGFEIKLKDQWRVLRLDESGFYVQELWRDKTQAVSRFEPTDGAGNRFEEIPFFFIGSVDNSPEVSPPPMFPIVALNLAHYRNSADYEEHLYITAQATPCYSGLTEDWVENVWKGKAPLLGSRAAIMLPTNASAQLLQPTASSEYKEAMADKTQQMISLGAKLVEPSAGPQKTAYEASIDEASENSVLTGSATNVNSAFTNALRIVDMFNGSNGGNAFELNTDFELAVIGTEERRQVISEWSQNALTFGEMRAQLRRAGVATETDEKAKAEIDKEADKEAERIGNNGGFGNE